MTDATTEQPPTAEEIAQAAPVAGAAAESIAAGDSRDDTVAKVKAAAHSAQIDLSDESIDKLVDTLIERLHALGAMDPPPAPAPLPAPETAAAASAEVAELAPPPTKLTWAERHFGDA